MRAMSALLSLLLLFVLPGGGSAQDQQQLGYPVLSADQQGINHFRNEYLVWQATENVGTGLLRITPYLNAEKNGFLHLPQWFSADPHPSPSKRFIIVLTGILQIEAGDGEQRTFARGSGFLVTDTQGPGHRSIVVGEQDVFIAWVPRPSIGRVVYLMVGRASIGQYWKVAQG